MTTTPPVWCATRLRYAPNQRLAIVLDSITIEMGLGFSSPIWGLELVNLGFSVLLVFFVLFIAAGCSEGKLIRQGRH